MGIPPTAFQFFRVQRKPSAVPGTHLISRQVKLRTLSAVSKAVSLSFQCICSGSTAPKQRASTLCSARTLNPQKRVSLYPWFSLWGYSTLCFAPHALYSSISPSWTMQNRVGAGCKKAQTLGTESLSIKSQILDLIEFSVKWRITTSISSSC